MKSVYIFTLRNKQTKKVMLKKITKDGETRIIVDKYNTVSVYEKCGWTVIDSDMLTFKNKDEENKAWMERFGD